MDMIDILGGLLGRKAGGSGGGMPDILKDIFARAGRPAEKKETSPERTDPATIGREAEELEDLLNVARDRNATREGGQPQKPAGLPQAERDIPAERPAARPGEQRPAEAPPAGATRQNEQALVLVRAMVNAAKADGQLSTSEKQSIVRQFGDDGDEMVRFLRDELSKPLDVREFAWSVPLGMEQQVYAMSLIAIDVDSQAETAYLDELAHGLRIPAEARDQIQRRYGARQLG